MSEDLDSIIDLAREEIAAVRATTEAEWARIREFQHEQRVEWRTPVRDWRGSHDY